MKKRTRLKDLSTKDKRSKVLNWQLYRLSGIQRSIKDIFANLCKQLTLTEAQENDALFYIERIHEDAQKLRDIIKNRR